MSSVNSARAACGALAIAMAVIFGGAAAPRGQDTPTDALDRLNAAFRDVYSRARAETVAEAGPIVLVRGDDLILLNGAERHEARVIPPGYHHLKAVSHAALAAELAMRLEGEEARSTLERLAALIPEVRGRLDSYEFDSDQLDRQAAILDATLGHVAKALDAGGGSEADRLAFARAMGPLVLENARDAARLAIDAYRCQMESWRRTALTPDQWRRLRVIVCGLQMPRERNLAVQTFARLLNVPGECHRLVYAEALPDEARAIDLLGTHLLDGEIAVSFFNDPIRMERDLLGDAAAAYLDELEIGP